jgi:hypothetical protein
MPRHLASSHSAVGIHPRRKTPAGRILPENEGETASSTANFTCVGHFRYGSRQYAPVERAWSCRQAGSSIDLEFAPRSEKT